MFSIDRSLSFTDISEIVPPIHLPLSALCDVLDGASFLVNIELALSGASSIFLDLIIQQTKSKSPHLVSSDSAPPPSETLIDFNYFPPKECTHRRRYHGEDTTSDYQTSSCPIRLQLNPSGKAPTTRLTAVG